MSDYIEREAAEKRLFQRAEIANSAYIDQTPCQIMMLAQNVVHLVPAADVRPVARGKWEDVEVTYVADKTTLPFERISSMRCNQCNRYHTEIYYYGNPTEMANYCPNCGAEMREEN